MLKDITGQKFGRLLAIERVGKKKNNQSIWNCLCDCGKQLSISIAKLRNGTIISCGCVKKREIANDIRYGKENLSWKGEGLISRSFYTKIYKSALFRNKEFKLTMKFLYNLFLKQNGKCALSGEKLILPVEYKDLRNGKYIDNLASLDRIDPKIGYIKSNVQWVSKQVNFMKNKMNEDKFILYINKIYNYLELSKIKL